MIRITSKKAGFRRCGQAHPAKAMTYDDGRWSAEELARLQAEPMLIVEVLPDPAEGGESGGADGGAGDPGGKAGADGKEPSGGRGKR